MFAQHLPARRRRRRLRRQKRDGVRQGQALGVGPLGDGGVDLAPVHIGAELAGLHAHQATIGMVAQRASRFGGAEASAATLFLGDDEVDGPIGADGENVVVPGQAGVHLPMLHIGAKTPDARHDGLLGLGMLRHFAGQGEQGHGLFKGDLGSVEPLGDGGALGLLCFAELQIGPEATITGGDLLARFRIKTKRAHARPVAVACRRFARRSLRQGAGELAFGIVGAADEGAELSKLQRELSRCAGRATARVRAIFLGGEDMGAQDIVERVENLRRAQILGAFDGHDEVAPEIAQHLFIVFFVV